MSRRIWSTISSAAASKPFKSDDTVLKRAMAIMRITFLYQQCTYNDSPWLVGPTSCGSIVESTANAETPSAP
ncbi:MAG: hypothetical protein FJW86_04030 [Actinobacteria bacterium]|nr:hypothetical protein [Actinomycetota bacterium]